MHPVLGWKVVERQQHIQMVGDFSRGLGELPAIQIGKPELVGELRRRVLALLARPDAPSGPLSAYGTALHGLALAGLAGGDSSAVRLLALAERLGVLWDF